MEQPAPPRVRFRIEPDRLRGLIRVKRLDRKELDREFGRANLKGWLLDLSSPSHREPSASDAMVLAVRLEVPAEYLFCVPTEYDGMQYWEVATRASLEIFLNRTPDGKRIAHRREAFGRYVGAHQEKSPMTVEEWRRALDLVELFDKHREQETQALGRMTAPTTSGSSAL